jgi:tetratricopeptide (TPR) repeat protein
MGIVYIVYDHEWHTPFAVKTFHQEFFNDSSTVRDRFTQEALTWVNLDSHPNVVEAHFYSFIQDRPYLFLEYVSGGDLSSWIGTRRLTQDISQVLRFAIQFCDGICHAVGKAILAHRDIKPQNCLIADNGTLKVTDFGLAKVFDDQSLRSRITPDGKGLSIGLSRTGTAAGTCTHMAPEQFDDAKRVDIRADIYSFGVLLFQLTNGSLPFIGRTRREFEQLHKKQRIPLLPNQPKINGVVQRCLAKNPADRYEDFQEVRNMLARAHEEVLGEAPPPPLEGVALNAVQWSNKGGSLSVLGRQTEALDCCVRAIALDPHYWRAWCNKGLVLNSLGRFDEALDCFERALEVDPNDALVWFNKGYTLFRLGRVEEAVACYQRAVQINPNPRLDQTLSNLGHALNDLGRYSEALDACERAIKLNHHLDLVWTQKGSALSGLGRTDEALSCYDRAIAINPRETNAWFNKARLMDHLKRSSEALECYEQVLEVNPHDAEAWVLKGMIFDPVEQAAEALTCFERALEIQPDNDDAFHYKTIALINLGRAEEMLVNHDAVKVGKSAEEFWNQKGVAFTRLNRYELALECFERALKINSEYAAAKYGKGAILILGYKDPVQALAYFEEASRMGFSEAERGIEMCHQALNSE